MVWGPFASNLDVLNNGGDDDSPFIAAVTVDGRPAELSPGPRGDAGLLGGQGGVMRPATSSTGAFLRTNG